MAMKVKEIEYGAPAKQIWQSDHYVAWIKHASNFAASAWNPVMVDM